MGLHNIGDAMLVKFICNPVFVGGKVGWSPNDTRLGGTEESIVEWSKRIAAQGHDVRVYYNGERGEWDGVKYLPYEMYEGGGVDINVKYRDFEHDAPAWYLTNEVDAALLNLDKFDGIILPSKWAFDNLGVQHHNIRIVPHGFDREKIYPEAKIPNQCLYASSPDRGLEYLIDFWPKVVKQVPDAQLIVTYGGKIDTPNTLCFGEIDDDFMSELFRTSQFWLHPCKGYELYCISGIKAQVARAIPVYYPVWALEETVTWGIRTNPRTFVDKLVAMMKDKAAQRELVNHHVNEYYPDWKDSTEILMKTIGVKTW